MVAAYMVALAACICTVGAQLFLKHGALGSHGRHAFRLWWNPWALSGYALFFAATLLNLKAYQILPLKAAVYLGALTLASVVVGSRAVFGERLSGRAMAGLGLVLAGILVFNLPG